MQKPTTTPPPKTTSLPDFSNTEFAFAHLSDAELRRTGWLFRLMNKAWLVKYSSPVALWAVENRLPLADWAVKKTIFPQFCGGATLLETQKRIEKLASNNVMTVLDFGAEAKETEADFNATMNENLRAIDFAARESETVPIVVSKITGIARFGLLEKIQAAESLTREDLSEYRNVLKRIDAICHSADKNGVAIYFDAEESWIQDTIDHLAWLMMRRYNKNRVVVFNTYQMYRHDRLQFLFDSFDRAKKEGFKLGIKLVRGAYMLKEAKFAEENGRPTPIQPSKAATDDAYNTAVRFCVENCDHLEVCNASHNAQSALLQAQLMDEKGIRRDDPRFMCSQLLGMSDNLTFNLARAGFRVAKYVVYGQVKEVIPYLLRRAQENTSVTGDAGRELQLILTELERRKL